jgi:hypothetical protein
MRSTLLLLVAFLFSGCSPKTLGDITESLLIASSGNKPPSFFKVANIETMRDYVFDMPDYTIALPSAKEEDFTLMGGWEGATYYNKNIVLHMSEFGILYHIHITTSIYKYGEREEAIKNYNIKYLRSKIKIDDSDKLYIKKFGREQYLCTVMEYVKAEYSTKKYIGYECYRDNNKGQSKSVHISLTYNKPNNSDIAKDYTYEDLKQRAQRMLDSLYIKDGW